MTNSKRNHLVGVDPDLAKKSVLGALGLFVLSLTLISSHELFSVPDTIGGLYLLIVAGVALASVSAYRNSGLLISWVLVFAPVSAPILYTEALIASGETVPVALPLSLVGVGVAGFWVPTAVLLGTLAFGVGVALRWAINR
ncbi:hypothetical protein HWV07_03885 [Natronomonas salina]|uniref:hypothetical protein n=1 Tax=Natronomonas salina TaxID=1710540 RepID=UPI0015B6B0A6|nr:hypothetical protein [Natronomonas salina]QLD88218.1 hypothetical protein HWV07_03885 [Natronomonas salina]